MATEAGPSTVAPPAPAAAEPAAKKDAPQEALREELVQNAVQFLRHPNVVGTPLARRVAFMRQKGLSQAEVDAALKRAAALADVAPPRPALPPPYAAPAGACAAPPCGSAGPSWLQVAGLAVLAAGVGAGAVMLVDTYVAPWVRRQLLGGGAQGAEDAADAALRSEAAEIKSVVEKISAGQEAIAKSLAELQAVAAKP
eukprot:m51a1_g13938 putative peroxisomal membrane protein pex14 (198) ;mRNA; f:878532-879125